MPCSRKANTAPRGPFAGSSAPMRPTSSRATRGDPSGSAARSRSCPMRSLRCSELHRWGPHGAAMGGTPGSPNLSPRAFPPRLLEPLAGKRDAGDEDVHLTDLESQHAVGSLDHVALNGARHRGELRLRVDRDENLEVNRPVGLHLHAHAPVRGLPPDPVPEVPRRGLVHPSYAFDLARGHGRDAGDHLVGHTNGAESGGFSHSRHHTPRTADSASGSQPTVTPRRLYANEGNYA